MIVQLVLAIPVVVLHRKEILKLWRNTDKNALAI